MARIDSKLQRSRFPAWSAPLLGVVVGALLGMSFARRANQESLIAGIVGGAIVGGFAGFLVWIADRPSGRRRKRGSAEDGSEGGVIGNTLSIFALLIFWIPFVGLMLSAITLFTNWRVRGWVRVVNLTAVGLSAVVSGFFAILLVANLMKS